MARYKNRPKPDGDDESQEESSPDDGPRKRQWTQIQNHDYYAPRRSSYSRGSHASSRRSVSGVTMKLLFIVGIIAAIGLTYFVARTYRMHVQNTTNKPKEIIKLKKAPNQNLSIMPHLRVE